MIPQDETGRTLAHARRELVEATRATLAQWDAGKIATDTDSAETLATLRAAIAVCEKAEVPNG